MDIKRGTVVFRREHGSARPTADSKVRCLTPVVAHLVASTGLDTVELSSKSLVALLQFVDHLRRRDPVASFLGQRAALSPDLRGQRCHAGKTTGPEGRRQKAAAASSAFRVRRPSSFELRPCAWDTARDASDCEIKSKNAPR